MTADLVLDGTTIEYRLRPSGSHPAAGPPLVFLHEGLGSLGLWRDVPDRIRAAVGRPLTLVYSRHGYGHSTVRRGPWPLDYLHHEADAVLPALLLRLGIERPVLVGHSDGASIALLHAGAGHSVSALVLLAPHVFVEDRSIAGCRAARQAYETTDLGPRMSRHHADADATFRGWNDAWLSPAFRGWDITDRLAGIGCPVLVIQGSADEYGTLAQVDAIERGIPGPVTRVVLDGVGHAPHVEAFDATLLAITTFLRGMGVGSGAESRDRSPTS